MTSISQRIIDQEIEELEHNAADTLNININETDRYIFRVKALLLRNGYRLVPLPRDNRIIQVIQLQTGTIIEEITANELRYVRISPQRWLEHMQQRAEEILDD